MKKMILGTAQLGLRYGIQNCTGKPSVEEAEDILNHAFKNGIRCLDTANAYGDSEEVIGRYINKERNLFEICTKLPVEVKGTDISDCYEKSKSLLSVDLFHVYYLHRFEQCKQSGILRQLMLLREKGLIRNIGISIYEPEELEYISENLSSVVDVVQIPFHMLNGARWIYKDLLSKAREKGLRIYARSIFLQGMLLADADSSICKKKKLSSHLRELNTLAKELGYHIAQLAVNYICSVEEIDRFLVGCETLGQLQQNISLYRGSEKLAEEICGKIQQISRSIEISSIDPRKWSD